MTDSALRTHIGSTLRRHRERASLTQAQLARQVPISQPTIARIERGERAPSVELLERLFAALGRQVRLRVEPLDHDLDQAIDASAAVPLAHRVAEARFPSFEADLAPVPHVFTGASAAVLQGVPLPVAAIEIMLAWRDCDAFTAWLNARFGQRWHPRYQQFGYVPVDPRRPGEWLWKIVGEVRVRARFRDELPESVTVRHGDQGYPVVPLAEVEIDDPETARLLRRYRQRQTGANPDEPPAPAR